VSDAGDNPFDVLRTWLDEAVAGGVAEPYAMTLATVSADGRPHARIVYLRGHDARGFVFFTNYDSAKGREIAATGRAALVFFWPALHRQVRAEGSVARLPAQESDDYFAQRPRGHRLSAWASAQSSVIPSRAYLDARMREEDERFAGRDVPRPPYWGGFRLTADRVEFWSGRPDRMHDRVAYVAEEGSWRIERLSP
jgi:pyridoxamine 5'-phosphate oxidase